MIRVFGLSVCYVMAILFCGTQNMIHADETEKEIPLWPKGKIPGKITATKKEHDTSAGGGRKVAGKSVVRIGHVSTPTITIFPAPEKNNANAAVVVCPGGGYHILAWDLEGEEVCRWLNSIGVTAVLLKYRVPRPKDGKTPVGALMDAQRAVSVVRSKAKELNLFPNRIGILGFSAGGHLSARVSTSFQQRSYQAIDSVDEVSCRPDFSVLIYPAYMVNKKNPQNLTENIKVTKNTPPSFLTMANDDPIGSENVLGYALALKKNRVPCEVHLYQTGGHGYGLRKSRHAATSWPKRCETWLRNNGWLENMRN